MVCFVELSPHQTAAVVVYRVAVLAVVLAVAGDCYFDKHVLRVVGERVELQVEERVVLQVEEQVVLQVGAEFLV